jgi:HlyD family secretion protein
MTENGRQLRDAIRRLNLTGSAVLVLLVGMFGGWIAFAELAGAVIASGFLVVETNVKKVQHPTGGVVGQIFIVQGSVVEQDQILIRLDDTVPKATVGIVRSQLDELGARQARLTAERDGANRVDFPDDLLIRQQEKSVAAATAGEAKLFGRGGRPAADSVRNCVNAWLRSMKRFADLQLSGNPRSAK